MDSKTARDKSWPIAAAVVFAVCGLGVLGLTALPGGLALVGARVLGAAALVCAALFVVARRPIERGVGELLASFSRVAADFARSVRSSWRSDSWAFRAAFVLIVLAGIGIRLCFLFQPIRYDEALSFSYFGSRPLYKGLSSYLPNNHLLHTALMHVSSMVLGPAPWAIRMPAFLAGVAVVPVAFATVRTLSNKYAALIGAALVATASALIEYSVLARGYTIQTLLFLLLIVLSVYLMRHREPAGWCAYGAIVALALYTTPGSVLPIGMPAVWLALTALTGRTAVPRWAVIRGLVVAFCVAALLTLLLYSPVIVSAGGRGILSNRFVAPKAFPDLVGALARSFGRIWHQWGRDIPAVVRGVLVACFAASLALPRRRKAPVPLLVCAVVGWSMATLVLLRVVPYRRGWLFLLPLYLGLASIGLVALVDVLLPKLRRHEALVYPIVALVCLLGLGATGLVTRSVYYSTETGTLRDSKAITVFLEDYLRPGDALVALGPSGAILEYQFRTAGISLALLRQKSQTAQRVIVVVNTTHGQDLAQVMDERGLAPESFEQPQMLREYDTAILYELNRLDSGHDEDRAPTTRSGEH